MAQVRIRKRGKTYSYIFEAGKKDDGKRKVVEKGGFATRKLAYDAGVAAYTDWKHGNIGIVSENISLKDFMMNWLENVLASNVNPTSLQCYTSCHNRAESSNSLHQSKRLFFLDVENSIRQQVYFYQRLLGRRIATLEESAS